MVTNKGRDDFRSHVHQQYKTQDNLQIRIQTHQLYTAPQVDFTSWILDQVEWQGNETVIDIGCGSGIYISPAQERCSRYIASDLSQGMLAGLTVAGLDRVNLDVHHSPFYDAVADRVLANHMLYYVDLDMALPEIRRILKPGGYLLAATNSGRTMVELSELQERVLAHLDRGDVELPRREALPFTLENGETFLNRHFEQVIKHQFPSALVFSEPQPVIDYIGTIAERFAPLMVTGIKWEQIAGAMRRELSEHIAVHGSFRVNKLTGVFVCQKK